MKENKNKCDLKSCMMCRQCLTQWIPALHANRNSYHFRRGEVLFIEGGELKGMYFINKGLVKVHKKWSVDKELILRIARDGDIVGHRGLGGDLIYPVTGTALEATDVCFVDLDFFNSTLRVNQELLFSLMMFFAAELKESEKRMRNLAHMPVKGRIANAVLYLKSKFGLTAEGNINLYLSRQDLASYTGTTYETLFRIMNELAEENAISMNGKSIAILNEDILHSYTKDKQG